MAIEEQLSLAWIIGQNVRRLRKGRGWKMETLKRMTGIPTSRISRYESGLSVPTTERLAVLAQALEVTPNDLMSWPLPASLVDRTKASKFSRQNVLAPLLGPAVAA